MSLLHNHFRVEKSGWPVLAVTVTMGWGVHGCMIRRV